MSRVKLMLDVIDDVCAVAESLQGLAASLRVLVQAVDGDEQIKATQLTEKAEPKPKSKEKPKAVQEDKPEEKQPTLTEVRAVLAEKSRSGKTAQVKEVLTRHGADKLSNINPAEYKQLLADVEVL